MWGRFVQRDERKLHRMIAATLFKYLSVSVSEKSLCESLVSLAVSSELIGVPG